jgi:hypothetical protein
MGAGPLISLIFIASYFFFVFTLLYIRRRIFMTNNENTRWFRTVLSGNSVGLILFWAKGNKKRLA